MLSYCFFSFFFLYYLSLVTIYKQIITTLYNKEFIKNQRNYPGVLGT